MRPQRKASFAKLPELLSGDQRHESSALLPGNPGNRYRLFAFTERRQKVRVPCACISLP